MITDFSDYASEDHVLFLRYYSKDALGFAVELLIKSKSLHELVVLHENEAELWENFKSLFQFVPAAGGVVKNTKGHHLFIYKKGKWDLPKGKVDDKESAKEAAIREVKEECGINDLDVKAEKAITYHLYKEGAETILKETHWFEMVSSFEGKFKVDKKEGIEKAEWVKEKSMDTVFSNTYPSIIELLSH